MRVRRTPFRVDGERAAAAAAVLAVLIAAIAVGTPREAHAHACDRTDDDRREASRVTVEAAIQRMQGRKQALADALFEGTGRGPLALTEEDVQALFGAG